MSGRLLRSIFVAALLAALVSRLVARRSATERPDVSRHPSNDGGPRVPLTAVPNSPTPPPTPPTPPPVSAPAGTAADATGPNADRWVPSVDGACPDGYPVKAKLRSGIFHLPGMLAYDRTQPDRCYPSAEAAEADGLRVAKR